MTIILVTSAGWFMYDHRNALIDGVTTAIARLDPPARSEPPLTPQGDHSDDRTIRLGSQPALDIRARAVTRWSLSVPGLGEVAVYVPIGKTPREALTVALAERGYQVLR